MTQTYDLDALRAAVEKATPGPYRRVGRDQIWADTVRCEGDDDEEIRPDCVAECYSPFEADLLCAAANALPALLDDAALGRAYKDAGQDGLAEIILGSLESAWADGCGEASLSDLADAAARALIAMQEQPK